MTRNQLIFPYAPHLHIADVRDRVRHTPSLAQDFLEQEYRNPNGPRWTLVQWLKRHRLHNPTVRVIRNA